MYTTALRTHVPVNTRDIEHNIYHVRTQLVAAIIDGVGVRGNVDLADHVEQKRLLNVAFLRTAAIARVPSQRHNSRARKASATQPNATEMNVFSRFSSGICGTSICTTRENASKIEWS
jgi:hypothetical protein